MSATTELFALWKAAKGVKSDRQAMKILGLSPGAATHWNAGKEAGADVIERMARDIGDDPAKWAALAMAGQTKGEASRAWARMARRLGAAAAISALVVALPWGDAQEIVGAAMAYVIAIPTMPIMSIGAAALVTVTGALAWWTLRKENRRVGG